MKSSRTRRRKVLVRLMQKHARGVFMVAEHISDYDEEEIKAAYKLANEMITLTGEKCLSQDLPLVIACMQSQVFNTFIKRWGTPLKPK